MFVLLVGGDRLTYSSYAVHDTEREKE